MGSAVAAALAKGGHQVFWTSEGRSRVTAQRARTAGAQEVTTLAELVGAVDAILSVCPPHAAEEVASAVARLGFTGLYVDANAVAPNRALRIGELVASSGARAVDGGIIGPPPVKEGTTRLYLSGEAAPEVARLFAGGPLEARVLKGGVGAASALKMAYAATTKGTSALTSLSRALAEHHGVSAELVGEWGGGRDEMIQRAAQVAWRWAGEMEEIADTCEEAGLPGAMHRGAADLYRRWDARRDQAGVPVEELLDDLLRRD
jgi:3-hydroxyisobutyrate dehydrogenase-like beta-hydroxyacid dehydrogenase